MHKFNNDAALTLGDLYMFINNEWYQRTVSEVIESLGTESSGLTSDEAKARLELLYNMPALSAIRSAKEVLNSNVPMVSMYLVSTCE